MMNATAWPLAVTGSRWAQPDGQVMFILVITLAAAGSQYRPGDAAAVSPLQRNAPWMSTLPARCADEPSIPDLRVSRWAGFSQPSPVGVSPENLAALIGVGSGEPVCWRPG
jgi:hypothetical protein